jgi:hypothetical protein
MAWLSNFFGLKGDRSQSSYQSSDKPSTINDLIEDYPTLREYRHKCLSILASKGVMDKAQTDNMEEMLLASENGCDHLLRCNDFHSVKNAFFEIAKKFKEVDHPDAKMIQEVSFKIDENNFRNAKNNFIEDAMKNCNRGNSWIIEEVKKYPKSK